MDESIWKKAESEVIPPLQKVPGEVKPIGKLDHEMKSFRESIQKKNISELKDLLARQDKILQNASLLSKLPDQGEKVRQKKAEIEGLIKKLTEDVDHTSEILDKMNLIDTDAMEWKKGGSMYKEVTKAKEDSENVFKILASKEVPDKSTQDYTLELALKADSKKKDELKNAPFQQLKRLELDPKSKETIPLKRQDKKDGIKSRKIEVMPLPPENYERIKVQQIDLKESLELQKHQMQRLKEAQAQNAVNRLLQSSKKETKIVSFEGTSEEKMAYREQEEDDDEEEDESKDNIVVVEDSDDD